MAIRPSSLKSDSVRITVSFVAPINPAKSCLEILISLFDSSCWLPQCNNSNSALATLCLTGANAISTNCSSLSTRLLESMPINLLDTTLLPKISLIKSSLGIAQISASSKITAVSLYVPFPFNNDMCPIKSPGPYMPVTNSFPDSVVL